MEGGGEGESRGPDNKKNTVNENYILLESSSM
jgi:hypothetical protein